MQCYWRRGVHFISARNLGKSVVENNGSSGINVGIMHAVKTSAMKLVLEESRQTSLLDFYY